MTIQELVDEKGHLESQLYAVGVRESRFLSEKNKAEDDLKRVTANLAEERVIWDIDVAEKDRILSRAKAVQEELECKAINEARKAHLKETESALDQSNTEVDSLTSRLAGLQGDRNWLISQGLVSAFESLHESEPFIALLDRYVSYHQTNRVTPEFQEKGGKLTVDMADALEAVYNDPLSAYADLTSMVAEEGIDSLRQMLEVAEESEEE
ncbi:hypothetical protein Hanom_Chr02g00172381 [Helianthus anomalus]